jgi:hypothetical protein
VLFPASPELDLFEQRDADLVVFCATRLHAEPSIEFALGRVDEFGMDEVFGIPQLNRA